MAQHGPSRVNLVFNNAGIGGGGSFVDGKRDEWERTFGVCWGGVYNCSRAFVPLLVASDDGYLVNTSSVNGFWASLGPGMPHTAYSAAKFAVKGFSEALIEDFRIERAAREGRGRHAGPHRHRHRDQQPRRARVGPRARWMTEELAEVRILMARRGFAGSRASTTSDLQQMIKMMGEAFRDNAPVSAAQAATIILDGVRAGKWRILVGDDAHALDKAVRADPEHAYGPDGLNLGTINLG